MQLSELPVQIQIQKEKASLDFILRGRGAQTFWTLGGDGGALTSSLPRGGAAMSDAGCQPGALATSPTHPQAANKQLGRKTHRGSCSLRFGWTKEGKLKLRTR